MTHKLSDFDILNEPELRSIFNGQLEKAQAEYTDDPTLLTLDEERELKQIALEKTRSLLATEQFRGVVYRVCHAIKERAEHRVSEPLPQEAPEWFKRIQAELDEKTHSVSRNGNAFKLMPNGKVAWPVREKNIQDADGILVKTCYFRDDETGKKFLASLIEKAKQGVPVYVQYDIKASEHDKLKVLRQGLHKHYKLPERFKELKKAGGVVIPVNTGDWHFFTRKDHEKYQLTYHKGNSMCFIGGGMNIGDRYRYGGDPTHQLPGRVQYGYRDTDYEVQGPSTQDALREFVDDAERALVQNEILRTDAEYGREEHEKLKKYVNEVIQKDPMAFRVVTQGKASIRFIDNEPEQSRAGQHITESDLICLKNLSPGETITISVPYYLPTDEFLDAMINAANRGVKIKLMVNSQETDETRMAAFAARSMHRELYKKTIPGSVEIYEWNADDKNGFGPTHQKSIQFGQNGPFSTSSANLDYHSLKYNSEGACYVWGEEEVKTFTNMLDQDFTRANVNPLTQEDLERDSWWDKFKQGRARKHFRKIL